MRHREGNAFAREFRRQRKGIRVTGGERLPLPMGSSHPKEADRVDDRPDVQPKHGRARDLSGRDLPDYLPLRKKLPFSRRTIDRGIHAAAYNRFRIRGVYNLVRVYFRDGIPNDYIESLATPFCFVYESVKLSHAAGGVPPAAFILVEGLTLAPLTALQPFASPHIRIRKNRDPGPEREGSQRPDS